MAKALAMDAARKSKLEQVVVLSLLVVFALTLRNTLTRLGVFGGKQPAPVVAPSTQEPIVDGAPAASQITSTAPAGVRDVVRQLNEHLSAMRDLENLDKNEPDKPAGPPPPALTRDPLVSLLPGEEPAPEPVVSHAKGAGTKGAGTGGARTGMGAGASGVRSASRQQAPLVAVQGVIWGGSRPQALIDGQWYGVGQVIKGAKIIGISRGGVSFDVGGALFVVAPLASNVPMDRPATRR